MEKGVGGLLGSVRKRERNKRGISRAGGGGTSRTGWIMGGVAGAKGEENNRLFTCLMTGLLLWVPVAAERVFRHRFSFSQHLAFILLLLGGALLGRVFYLFYTTSWFDCFMPVFAGYLLMIFLLMPLCRKLGEIEEGGLKDRRSALSSAFILFLCSLGTACFWELAAFVADVLFKQTAQGTVSEEILQAIADKGYTGVAASWEAQKYVSVLDTDLDMLCHAVGSLVFCLHYLLHVFTKKDLGMGRLARDIRADEMNTAAI